MEPNPQTTKPQGRNVWKILFLSLTFLLMAGGLVFAGVYIGRIQEKKAAENPIVTPVSTSSALPSIGNIPAASSVPTSTENATGFSDDQVQYLPKPLKVSNMGIMKQLIDSTILEGNPGFIMPDNYDIEANCDYYKIGIMKDPIYKDKELFLINVKNLAAMFGGTHESMMRFIKSDTAVVILTKNSDIYLNTAQKTVPANLKIEDIYKLKSFVEGYNLVFKYKGNDWIFNSYGVNFNLPVGASKIGEIDTKEFLQETRTLNEKPAFRALGTGRGYFLKLPDTTYQEYRLSSTYFSTLPQKYDVPNVNPSQYLDVPSAFLVSWTDGLTPKSDPNTAGGVRYDEFNAALAGVGNSPKISYYDNPIDLKNDLVKVGSDKAGDEFFALSNKNHIIYTDFYKSRNDYSNFVKNLTFDQFMTNRPVFFWKDVFGDYHAMFRGDFEVAAGIAKPAIYLYPENEATISVKIDPSLTHVNTIPNYNNGWNVLAKPNGEILSGGKSYDYLFYEGDKKYFDFKLGDFDVVKKENIKIYLSEKLTSFGLNEKERSQFIEYWEPKMENSSYYKVSFMQTEELNQKIPLFITPKADTLIRVLMKYEGMNRGSEKIDISNNVPLRKGFTVVEWGGVR